MKRRNLISRTAICLYLVLALVFAGGCNQSTPKCIEEQSIVVKISKSSAGQDVDECAKECLKSINSSRRSERRAIGSNSKAKEVCDFKDIECMCIWCNTKYMLSKGHVCYQQTD